MNFLKKARHDFVLKNENRKHIIFMIAEVFLIFVGITSALQLESWSELNGQRERELLLLNQIKNELTLINIDVQDDLNLIKLRSDKSIRLYKMCGNTTPDISEFDFMSLIQDVFETNTFNPQYSVIEEAINTGSLALIQNNELRHVLYQNNKNVEKVKQYVEKFNTYIFEFALNHHLKYVPYRNWDNREYDDLDIGTTKINSNVFFLLDDLYFENQVGMVFYYCQRFMVWYNEDIIRQNEELIERITVELNLRTVL